MEPNRHPHYKGVHMGVTISLQHVNSDEGHKMEANYPDLSNKNLLTLITTPHNGHASLGAHVWSPAHILQHIQHTAAEPSRPQHMPRAQGEGDDTAER